ncbi:CoA-acylating methylmalonate-semialdehyde dehydrogenase [Aeribacillus pallidus]|uniref:CoA-acylating methylmalonate-semialdehyde dehydrogenase n=1 Tax=Aeribacillus pallidus TaxID=33936 RepID=UPI0009ED4344|nr:CoA-acylating methylmalonate-semialdehyde dehydrogenase [Aeribacillus pallidus]
MTLTRVLKNFIGGEWVEAQTTNRQPVLNPATAETLAEVPISTEKDVDEAVKIARETFEEWRRVPAPKRARIMFRFHELLTKNHKELAELITKENGKTFEDAYGEVQRGIECVEFAAGIPHLLKGEILPDIAEGIESAMFRYPVGVVGGITPFNFPMMVPCWMFPLAIACGNTFVLKPSEQTPLLAERLAELIAEAGLPKGVLNIVHGAHDVVNRLLSHPDVDAISFVGSQPVAEYVYRTAASYGKRVQALAGAKNHAIVLADANMDLTIKGIMNAAFGSAGQRCMATSVVVAVEEIADELIENLIAAANQIKLGNGLDPNVKLGPVISDKHLERVHGYIESGIAEGANLIRDGRKDSEGTKGFFLGPTIFDEVKPSMKIWKEEIFAPVLSIVRVKNLDEAIELANKSDFGNGSVIYTNSGSAVRKYRENIEVGMLGVNINVPAPMAFFPFSGWKNSFYGDLHANGRDGVEFYTRRKMITTRWFG